MFATLLNKRILLALGVIVFVAAVAISATGAFFSDTETSSGNTFTAGAIDLGVDNTSYYNGRSNSGTTWTIDWDLSKNEAGESEVHQFFNFDDLKPGDWGEDTISLHVNNNDSYLCADVTLTSDNDNDITEPEGDDGDNGPAGIGNGDLADAVNFYWWADDGDNVYETCSSTSGVSNCQSETLLPAGSLGNLNVNQTATVALADSQTNIWGYTDNVTGVGAPLPGNTVAYVAKAWCFGNSAFLPHEQDGLTDQGPNVVGRGVICDGSGVNNITQTDSMTADISFRAVQSRNNTSFICSAPTVPQTHRVESSVLQFGSTGWGGWSCPAGETAVGGGTIGATQAIAAQGLATANIDGQTYPIYPHYTFGTGETGYVVHNGAVGQSLQIFVDCQL